MNQREAKRDACQMLAIQAEHWIAEGGDPDMSDVDNNRIAIALQELADELFRRAGGTIPSNDEVADILAEPLPDATREADNEVWTILDVEEQRQGDGHVRT